MVGNHLSTLHGRTPREQYCHRELEKSKGHQLTYTPLITLSSDLPGHPKLEHIYKEFPQLIHLVLGDKHPRGMDLAPVSESKTGVQQGPAAQDTSKAVS